MTFAAGLTSELKSIKVSKFDLFFHLGAHFIFTLIFILAFLSAKYGLFFIFFYLLFIYLEVLKILIQKAKMKSC